MSSNIRALPTRQTEQDQDVTERALEGLRLLIRQEIVAYAQACAEPEPLDNEELTVEQVARIKKVKTGTVYVWVREGLIKVHRTPAGRLRFYRRDVES
jgi:excisionase family DNA binding protein